VTARPPPGSVDDRASADDAAFAEEALRLAGLAYDRVMSGVEPELDTMPPELEPADAVRWIGDRVTELVAGFAELPLDRLVDLGAPAPPPDPSASEPEPRGEPLTMTSSRGGLGEVRIWVHPIGELTTGTLRFRLTDLQPSTGEALPGGTAVFAPPEISVPLSAATSVLLRYPIPAGATPGRYHGLVLAGGVTDAVVPVTVVIT
jgi:hypothetical protein